MASENSSSEVIRILLIGRTGQGKSTTANSLVGHEGLFKESRSSKSETKTCDWSKERTCLGRRLEVVDTPGIFDTESDDDNAKTHKELLKSLVLTMPGFHAIAYVLKCGEKITDEFKKTQDLFFRWFGPGVENFTFVILTWCSSDEMKKEYISDDPQSKLEELVEKCGGRVSIIENKGPKHEKNKQIKLIYKAVDEIIAANGNRCFTNLTFQLAQSYFHNKCPQTLTQDSIILLKKAGLKEENLVWLGDIDRIDHGDDSRSTSETTSPMSTENADDETQGACGNLPIYDAKTDERISNTARTKQRNSSEKGMGKNNTTFATPDLDMEEKMSDIAYVNEIESGSTIEQIPVKKQSNRRNRQIDYTATAVSNLTPFTESNNGSDLSTLVTVTDTDVKNSVKNNDQVLTGFKRYLQKARDYIKDKIGCIVL